MAIPAMETAIPGPSLAYAVRPHIEVEVIFMRGIVFGA